MVQKRGGNVFVPLYRRTRDRIERAIEDGTYAPGTQIPTEFELMRIHAVSLMTVRRAVRELVAEGRLIKQQGRGTFVEALKVERRVRQSDCLQSFTHACEASGMEPGARLISRRVLPADSPLAELLGMRLGADLVRMVRICSADGAPVKLEYDFFPQGAFPFLEMGALPAGSIFEAISERAGRRPAQADPCTLEAVRAGFDVAKHLGVVMGEPMFFMNVRFLDEEGLPLLVCRQYIVGSRYTFGC